MSEITREEADEAAANALECWKGLTIRELVIAFAEVRTDERERCAEALATWSEKTEDQENEAPILASASQFIRALK